MNSNWIGVMVSVHCKDDKGTYQGQICDVTDSTMTLSKAFHNGVPRSEAAVTINAADIEELKLIDSQPRTANGRSTVTVAKPIAKRAGRSISISECTATGKFASNVPAKCKQPDPEPRPPAVVDFNGLKNGTPNKKEKFKLKRKDEAAFGTSIDQSMHKDFDFEKNLALFNKAAVWQKINAQKPDVVNQVGQARGAQRYRHDENILTSMPAAYRQITVPAPDAREYVSDDGLVIPSITQELRRQLLAAAERCGLGPDRHTELMGRAAAEMALGLLGGGHRLSPHNTHQRPTVALLCGPHRQGAAAINCARHLANHGVNTVVLHTDGAAGTSESELLRSELALYKLTGNKVSCATEGLPSGPDLIILALCCCDETYDGDEATHSQLAEWTYQQNRATVLALDPPPSGTPAIPAKLSLVPVLPMSHAPENGKLYLCDLGVPAKVFKDVAIKYKSPFGPKFVIPLHPN